MRGGVADRGHRKRPERGDPEHADLHTRCAHFVHRVLDRSQHRAERDHAGLGVVQQVGPDQPTRIAAKHLVELLCQRRNQVKRLHLPGMREVANFGEGLRPDHRTDGDRLRGVQHLAWCAGRQPGVDLLLGRDVDTFVRVRQDETVHADHDRQGQLLGDAKRLDVQVQGLLVGFGKDLDPAGIAHRHAVGVVVPDVDRGADGAVGHGHHDRQAQPGRVVDGLCQVQQALAGGGCVRPGTGG